MSTTPCIAALTGKGILLVDSNEPYLEKPLHDETIPNIRNIVFSPKGTYFAFRSDRRTDIVQCSDWKVTASLPGGLKDICFSPLDTYLMTWETYVMNKDYPQGKPNLYVYKCATGEKVQSFTQKLQLGWEPQWSSDEKLFALQEGGRVLLYEDGNLDRYTHQIIGEKISSFSMSPSPAPAYFIATFTLGKSGQPSFWRIYKFPEFEAGKAVASKSSFQADKASFFWNRRGTNVFALTHIDVDKTGGSYYGRQALSHADVKGNSGNVAFSKEGPIHAITWNPCNWNEWIAVYGHTPAKATVYNAKCEPLFEFGTGSWNTVHYSPDGCKILLGGFGNIAMGCVEVWDVRGYKKIGSFSAPDTTFIQWDPRSECLLTATTYPRLTVGNGYKIWHYTGALMRKQQCEEKDHLFEIKWQTGNFPKSEMSRAAPKAIVDEAPKPAAQAYRPPGARNKPSNFVLHDEHEKPHKPGEPQNAAPSKAAIKQKEKREARKAKKAEERVGQGGDSSPAPPPTPTAKTAFISTGDPEKDKKIKSLNKKLSDIAKLKELKSSGKALELNQKAKIDSEPEILEELAKLRL